MEEVEQDGVKKCPTHGKMLVFFCDNGACKTMLCKICLSEGDHDSHMVHSLGALKATPTYAAISKVKSELKETAGKLQTATTNLGETKTHCVTYQEEIEKICSTEIGKALLEQMGKSKEGVFEDCRGLALAIEKCVESVNRTIKELEAAGSQLKLVLLIEKAKTVSEDAILKELGLIADTAIAEGKSILAKIEGDNYEEKLSKLKVHLGQQSSVSGKRGKPEPKLKPNPEPKKTAPKKDDADNDHDAARKKISKNANAIEEEKKQTPSEDAGPKQKEAK